MRLKFFFALAVVFGFSFTQSSIAQQTAKITSSGIGYLEYLPDGYNTNSNDYPLVIFLHGIGEKGTTSTDPNAIKSSAWKVANVGLAKNVKYGTKYPFILISPQLKSNYGTWPANYIMDVLNHVKKDLRVNDRRVYVTGLSLGGFGVWTVLGAYPDSFAAALPICSGGSALTKACAIAASDVPVWGYHALDDKVVSYTVTTRMINAINACTPQPSPLAKTTLFPTGGHGIWDRVYKQTDALNWMLGWTNGSTSTTSPTNSYPVVSAGSDKSITLPTNEVYIQGTASDSDGSIASYTWTKTSGGTASLSGNYTSKLRAYNLAQGTYYFRLTVKDNDGAVKYDDVKVNVSSSTTTNVVPIANAGSDMTTSSSSIKLYGSGTDKDGQIVSYKWVKTSGAYVSMTGTSTSAVTINGMVSGKYFFRLWVTDDKGATDYDDMLVTVSGTSTSGETTTGNLAPIANAGSDRTTSYTAITVVGSATDNDGSIASYHWTQTGGAASKIKNPYASNMVISELRDGKYYYRLTVKDNEGASDYDDVVITVSNSGSTASISPVSNIAPVANAGNDKRIGDAINALKVYGSGYDKDGSIVSYKWTQYGGPDVNLYNATSKTLTVSGLDVGKYYLKLTVKDNDGSVDTDNMLIVVNES